MLSSPSNLENGLLKKTITIRIKKLVNKDTEIERAARFKVSLFFRGIIIASSYFPVDIIPVMVIKLRYRANVPCWAGVYIFVNTG